MWCSNMMFKIKSKNTKQEQSKHESKSRGKWGSGYPLQTGHTHCVIFVVIGKTDQSVENTVINNGLTISMENASQHST